METSAKNTNTMIAPNSQMKNAVVQLKRLTSDELNKFSLTKSMKRKRIESDEDNNRQPQSDSATSSGNIRLRRSIRISTKQRCDIQISGPSNKQQPESKNKVDLAGQTNNKRLLRSASNSMVNRNENSNDDENSLEKQRNVTKATKRGSKCNENSVVSVSETKTSKSCMTKPTTRNIVEIANDKKQQPESRNKVDLAGRTNNKRLLRLASNSTVNCNGNSNDDENSLEEQRNVTKATKKGSKCNENSVVSGSETKTSKSCMTKPTTRNIVEIANDKKQQPESRNKVDLAGQTNNKRLLRSASNSTVNCNGNSNDDENSLEKQHNVTKATKRGSKCNENSVVSVSETKTSKSCMTKQTTRNRVEIANDKKQQPESRNKVDLAGQTNNKRLLRSASNSTVNCNENSAVSNDDDNIDKPKSMKRKRNAPTQNISKKGKQLKLQERMNLEAPEKEFVLNEVVLAIVPGFSPWPARILEISGVTIKVEFLGTGEINLLRASAVSRFELNKAISFLQRKGYAKSMKELEMALEIPYEYSIFE